MTNDPFANDPWASDASTAEDTWPADGQTDLPAQGEADDNPPFEVPEGDFEVVSLTFKAHGGFDAPWVVIKGRTIEEALHQLDRAEHKLLFDRVAQVAKKFSSLLPGGGQPQGGQPRQGGYQRQGGGGYRGGYQQQGGGGYQQPQQQGGGRACPHGQMIFREGVSQKGNPYRGYFCPAPQGAPDKCRPVFLGQRQQ